MKTKKSMLVIALGALAVMAGCSKEDVSSDLKPSTSTEIKTSEQKISVDLGIEQFQSDELRMEVRDKDKTPAGEYNGVKLVFTKGERVKLYTYFKQGATTAIGTPIDITIESDDTVQDVQTSTNPNGDDRFYYPALGELVIPPGIDVNGTDPVYVAGAIGVESIDADGKAVVKPIKVEHENIIGDDGDDSTASDEIKITTLVPMYFPFTALETKEEMVNGVKRTGKALKGVKLKFFGSLLSLRFQNKMYDPVRLSQVVFDTGAFSTAGEMDLTTATATSAPNWTATQTSTTFQTINFPMDDIDKNAEKSAFLWIKPVTDGVYRPLTAHIREGHYTYDPTQRSEAITQKHKVRFNDHKVYRLPKLELTSGLIMTEYWYPSDGLGTVWEFYNPTTEPINLGDYYFTRYTYGSGGTIDPNKTVTTMLTGGTANRKLVLSYAYDRTEVDGKTLRDVSNIQIESASTSDTYARPPQDLMLPPGKMAIYQRGLSGLNGYDSKDNVAYVIEFYGNNPINPENVETAFRSRGLFVLTKGIPVYEAGSAEPKTDNISDVFFFWREADKSGRRYPNATFSYARRPDRNFGRKYWALGEDGLDSDWVYRSDVTGVGIGYRFEWKREGDRMVYIGSGAVPYRYAYLNRGGVSTKKYVVPTFWDANTAH